MSAKEDIITSAGQAIHDADVILIAAGAGCSTDSGIQDYTNYALAHPQLASITTNVYDISNSELFLNNPRLAWGVYGTRMKEYNQAAPHKGYKILQKWCQQKEDWWVYVSNVDKMFLRAGFSASNVVECMGSIYELQCAIPCCDLRWNAPENTWMTLDVDSKTLVANGELPRCPQCYKVARPCTKLAMDTRWVSTHTDSSERNFNDDMLRISHSDKTLVVLEIGCGMQMPKVRLKAESVVRSFVETNRGVARFIRVNANADHAKLLEWARPCDISIETNALQTLNEIDARITDLDKK